MRYFLLAMVNFKRIFVGVLVGSALCILGFIVYSGKYSSFLMLRHPDSTVVLTFNQKTPLRVTVLKDSASMMRGLSGRDSLGPTEGMLFVFPTSEYQGIWMKDMHFPIDIVWLDERGTVVTIEENARPESFPKVFEPTSRARFVIEANAYFMNSFNIKVGSVVSIPNDALPADLQKQ